MKRTAWVCAIPFLVVTAAPSWSQSREEQTVRELVEKALRTDRLQPWASLLIRADAEAVKLQRRERGSSGDIRSVKITGFGNLHYRWNELQHSENYEHDLARMVVRDLRGTPAGADALVALLGRSRALLLR